MHALVVVLVALAPELGAAGVMWPGEQLLPSFSPPAATQDLIYIRPSARTFEAEGPRFAHATGRAETDGWLCQVGIDVADAHMLYGPYEHDLPVGRNTARFRMKIDVNTGNADHVATVDVRDSTSGAVLASRPLARDEFAVAGDWVEFPLEFELPALGHGVELRVYWTGKAYIKVDRVRVDRGPPDEMTLFASLKGVVNATQPRIFSYEGDAFAEGPYTWLESLGLAWDEHTDNWAVLEKYRGEVAGLIVYDPAQPHTVNLATTLAGRERALVVGPALLPRLTAPPFAFPIIEDLRGRFASTAAVYQYLYDEVWPTLTHRLVLGLSPAHHRAGLREYAVAIGAAVIWLDPNVAGESAMLDLFLSSLAPGAAYMGWWPEEAPGVDRASRHGIPTVASDYATNLTVHGGMPRDVRVTRIPPKPILEDKIYVAFILSDGDNLQYVEHLMRKLWNNPDRGKVPIGWTVSPVMLDAMPGALDFYHATSTPGDNLISGPSGWGYGYPNVWIDQPSLERFATVTDDYALRAGLRVVTVWNTIVGGIDGDVGATFAEHAPSLLGLTAQNTGGGLTIYGNRLPGFALSCNYCTGAPAIHDHIASAASGWDGSSPRFILIQAQPWTNVTPSTFLSVQDALGPDYVVVRPDNWFQLLRQANGLPIEPVNRVEQGVYFLINKASGKCVAVDGLMSIAQAACADVDAQRFRVTPTSNGYVTLAPLSAGGQVIDVAGGTTILSDDVGSPSQQWQPVWEAADEYHLIARHSDRCLDVPGSTTDDVELQEWTCNGTGAQAFVLTTELPPAPDPTPDAGALPQPDAGPGSGSGETTTHAGGCTIASTTSTGDVALLSFALLLLLARRRTPAAVF